MSLSSFLQENRTNLVLSGLALLVLAVYWQTTGFSFINFDDNLYVYSNDAVLSGINRDSVKWAFTAFHSANWHPLTWLSHMLDVQFFGANAGAHHATNVVIHLVNTLLAFHVFKKLTGDEIKSMFVAAIFAIHPAHVESVAWVSERKDVLSTMFWLLTMIAYVAYSRSVHREADTETGGFAFLRTSRYWLVVALFALGLMSKPMVVTLPFVLLLLDAWPLDRWRSLSDLKGLLIEKAPMFVLSAASSYVTVLAQRSGGAFEALEFLPIGTRVLNAVNSFAAYSGMFLAPRNLALSYTYDHQISIADIMLPAVVLIAVSAFAVWQFPRRKYLLIGWLWFLGTLVPVIGLVQVGAQSMADRYTYVPYFGLCVMFIWGLGDLVERLPVPSFVLPATLTICVGVLTVLAFNQTALWQNHETLYKATLARTKNNVLVAHNLCHYLMTEDRLDEAESYCRQAIEMRPNYPESYNTLGIIEMKRTRYAEAEADFRQALEISPNFVVVYANLATALSFQGKADEAERVLERGAALGEGKLDPVIWTDALRGVAIAFVSAGNLQKALDNYNRAIYVSPNRADVRAEGARILFELKRYDEALALIQTSLQLQPADSRALNTYGAVLLALGRRAEAISVLEQAVKADPEFADAKSNLQKAKEQK